MVVKESHFPGSIETLRAIAIIILVSFHVIGGRGTNEGLNLPDGHALRIYADLLVDLRMPLFAFISGAVYALRPVSRKQLSRFLSGKTRRLALPGAVAITAFAVFSVIFTQDDLPSPVWLIYLQSYAIYWFVQAIFVIFFTVCVADILSGGRLAWPLYVVASLALINGIAVPSDFMSLNAVTLLLPHFLMGVLIIRNQIWIEQNRRLVLLVALIGFSIGLVMNLQEFSTTGHFSEERLDLQSYLFGTGAAVAGLLALPRIASLQWLGAYSFTVYLYHVFATSGTRRLLEAMQIESTSIHLIAGILLGIAFPLGLHQVAARWNVSRTIVLGLRPRSAEVQGVRLRPAG